MGNNPSMCPAGQKAAQHCQDGRRSAAKMEWAAILRAALDMK